MMDMLKDLPADMAIPISYCDYKSSIGCKSSCGYKSSDEIDSPEACDSESIDDPGTTPGCRSS